MRGCFQIGYSVNAPQGLLPPYPFSSSIPNNSKTRRAEYSQIFLTADERATLADLVFAQILPIGDINVGGPCAS